MIKDISVFFTRISSTPLVMSSFIISLVFIAVILPEFDHLIDAMSAGLGMPDQLLYYDAEKLRQFALAYGEHGRRLYVKAALTYDLAWPIVYISFLCIAISYFCNLCFSPDSRLKFLNMSPLVPALFDALENSTLSIVMLTFPDTMTVWLNAAGLFTAGKWVTVTLSFLVLGGLMLHTGWKEFAKFLEKS